MSVNSIQPNMIAVSPVAKGKGGDKTDNIKYVNPALVTTIGEVNQSKKQGYTLKTEKCDNTAIWSELTFINGEKITVDCTPDELAKSINYIA